MVEGDPAGRPYSTTPTHLRARRPRPYEIGPWPHPRFFAPLRTTLSDSP